MSPSVSISLTYAIIGIIPAVVLLVIFKIIKHKHHLFWIIGLLLIVLGAISIGIGTELLTNTEEWLPKQIKTELITAGKEAVIHLKVWAYVFPGATIALGVNLITEFMLREAPGRSALNTRHK